MIGLSPLMMSTTTATNAASIKAPMNRSIIYPPFKEVGPEGPIHILPSALSESGWGVRSRPSTIKPISGIWVAAPIRSAASSRMAFCSDAGGRVPLIEKGL